MNAKRAFLCWQGLCLDRRRDACVPSGLFFGTSETPAHPDSGLIGYCQNTWHFDIFRKGSIVRRRWYFCSVRPLLDPYLTLTKPLPWSGGGMVVFIIDTLLGGIGVLYAKWQFSYGLAGDGERDTDMGLLRGGNEEILLFFAEGLARVDFFLYLCAEIW